ncbi:MAG: sigma factor regulator FecR, partial [Deltaproteobacteria bacterium]|nr:sigma factor regulator FecR [Deltaproteobacteria bacterium]
MMPRYAQQAGAFLSIINLSKTPIDHMCDVLIRSKAGPVLSDIAARVKDVL